MKLRRSLLGITFLSLFNLAKADDSSAAAMQANPPPATMTNAVAAQPADTATPPPTNAPVPPPAPAIMTAPIVGMSPEPEPAVVKVERAKPVNRPFMIGGELGTTGAGIVGRWQFADHFGVGAAFDYLSMTYNGRIQGNDYHTHLRLSTVPITLDAYPLNNNYWRVSAGVVFNRNHFTGTSTGTVDLNGTPYVGTALLSVKQQPVNPYLAMGGNVYFTRDHRFSLAGELGLIFTGEPRVSLTLNPPNGAVETQRRQEESQIRHYARYAEVWPVLKLSLNYSF